MAADSASILSVEARTRLGRLVYRYRFLAIYVLIGILSLCVEAAILTSCLKYDLPFLPSTALAVVSGILIAFWLNVRFNFKIPSGKRNRALLYFTVISAGSAIMNFIFKEQLEKAGWSYEQARFAVAGSLFLIAYTFHRKYSFADYKKVGVAIYANGVEDIRRIFSRIGHYPDFIHVDIIDSTFGPEHVDTRAYRLEVIRAYWSHKEIHVHIMSRKPSQWIPSVAPYCDTIFIHLEIDEDLQDVLKLIRSQGRKAGICATMATPLDALRKALPEADALMLLCIVKPGYSGQTFDMNAILRIAEINQWPERRHVAICVDGGVNERIIGLLNVENVVSGSSVLNHADPTRQIMRLQTSGSYEVD